MIIKIVKSSPSLEESELGVDVLHGELEPVGRPAHDLRDAVLAEALRGQVGHASLQVLKF